MKKNKLYTANKWNRHLFIPEENLFVFGGGTVDPYAKGKNIVTGTNYLVSAATKRRGLFDGAEDLKGGIGLGTVETAAKKELSKPIGGLRKPASAGGGMSTDIKAGLIAGGTALGGIAANAISDGYESSAGSTISNVGSTVGSAVGAVNPVAGAIVSVGSQLVGGLANRAFGTKVNEAKLAQANADINSLNSFTSNAGSFDGIIGPEATASVDGTYKGGWFNKSGAEEKQKALEERITAARQFANRSIDNNIYNITDDQVNNMLANYAAFGGPLDMIGGSDMGAINYDLMSDYLTIKRQNAQNKNQMTNMFMGSPSKMFDFGGTLQTNGSDFPTGLMHIGAGGSHESNPNDGVQLGVDTEGTPNLVEENETVYNDYVFSNRIEVPEEAKKWLGVKGKDLTFADASKQLEKEIKERPNDPVSRAGLKAQMERLEEEQEFVKRCTSYSVGEVYDVDNNEVSLLNHNGYEYEKLG